MNAPRQTAGRRDRSLLEGGSARPAARPEPDAEPGPEMRERSAETTPATGSAACRKYANDAMPAFGMPAAPAGVGTRAHAPGPSRALQIRTARTRAPPTRCGKVAARRGRRRTLAMPDGSPGRPARRPALARGPSRSTSQKECNKTHNVYDRVSGAASCPAWGLAGRPQRVGSATARRSGRAARGRILACVRGIARKIRNEQPYYGVLLSIRAANQLT